MFTKSQLREEQSISKAKINEDKSVKRSRNLSVPEKIPLKIWKILRMTLVNNEEPIYVLKKKDSRR